MAEIEEEDRRGSRFDWVDFSGSVFSSCSLSGTTVIGTDINHATFRGVEIGHTEISGDIEDLVINGVDVAPLIEAELDRRDPRRAKMRPTDPDGFREAWDLVEELWQGTVERARSLPPGRLHESVAGEWSFIETLRHLVFATDAWVRRAIQGDPAPWHPLDLPWDQMPDTEGIPRDRGARPTLDEVLELRHDRMAGVRELLAGLTHEQLAADTEPVDAPGWPPPRSFPVRECLLVVLNEEWQHRLFAERDLDALT